MITNDQRTGSGTPARAPVRPAARAFSGAGRTRPLADGDYRSRDHGQETDSRMHTMISDHENPNLLIATSASLKQLARTQKNA